MVPFLEARLQVSPTTLACAYARAFASIVVCARRYVCVRVRVRVREYRHGVSSPRRQRHTQLAWKFESNICSVISETHVFFSICELSHAACLCVCV